MPRTAIPVTQIVRAGIAKPIIMAGDATNDHSIASNNGRLFLEIKNTDATIRGLIIQTPLVTDNLALADLSVGVPAGETWMVGPFSTQTFNQTDESIWVDLTEATWEFRVFKL